jgi:hypothetical protein
MNMEDAGRVEAVRAAQRGVFTKTDLQVLLGERHPAAFTRRIQALVRAGVLRRFVRGIYVHSEFDMPTLSQRLAADSYISFGNVLARHLVIGTRPEHQLLAAKPGRAHVYRSLDLEIAHLHIAPHLDFGHSVENGVRWADAEKAALDTLYFHLRGRRYPFDIYSDIDIARLDKARLTAYLSRFRNPKFATFARGVLELA